MRTAPRRVEVRALAEDERPWLSEHLELAWGGREIASRGRLHDASLLEAFVAVADDLVGLATYEVEGTLCELVTIEAFRRAEGIGSALLAAVVAAARARDCERLWLVTTNDNLRALRFYQRRGLRLVAVHRGAVDEARAVKPAIPLIGEHGIAVHDELELELELGAGPESASQNDAGRLRPMTCAGSSPGTLPVALLPPAAA